MKKLGLCLTVLGMAAAVSLAGCGDGGMSASGSKYEKVWSSAVSDGGIRDYVKEHMDELDMEALETEAGNDELSLNQQFHATVLMCELEFQRYMKDKDERVKTYDKDGLNINGTVYISDDRTEISKGDDVFAAEYPISAAYAERFLAKVETAGEEFWDAVEVAKYPYNYFMNLFAAADSVSGETLVKMITESPETPSDLQTGLTKAIDKWLEQDPQRLLESGEQLMQADYFKDDTFYNLSTRFIKSSSDPVWFEDADMGLDYLEFMKTTMFPVFEQKYSADFKAKVKESELLGTTYYSTGLNISTTDILDLKEESTEAEYVELEGKKVVAFYHNPDRTEFTDSPAPLTIMGDFMLSLPEEQSARSLEEADNYLVLTPNYVLGDYYTMSSSNSIQIRQVFSFTSIDLYEAATGMLIRHIGMIKESPSDSVYYQSGDNRSSLEYPNMVSADELLFIYQSINEPEQFQHMMEVYGADQTALGAGDSARVGSWEMVMESYDILKSFEDKIYIYTAKDGHKFLRCRFTITNHSNEEMRLLPTIYYVGQDMSVDLTGGDGNTYKPMGGASSKDYFQGTTFAAGESMTRYLLFELPESLVDSGQTMKIEFSIKPQSAVYILE
ncbi:MAG: DUF4352 domain-containing protein [Lachnospiraceae bacterium]